MAATSEQLLKILLIGESAVGKSCLLLRYTDGKFQESFMTTIGVDFKTKHIKVDDKDVKLQIWDTAGQEKFRSITKAYYRGAHGILVVFDLSRRDTFNQTRMWIDSIKEASSDPIDMILVGNKADLENAVTPQEAKELADSYGIAYFQTSAKENSGIEDAFMYLAKIALEKKINSRNNDNNVTTVKPSNEINGGACC
ncbi:ras-related protein RABE1c-like [Histomonas meleagridis]|uniref:ras-related protein RABE1c-like n=1 Tax=Histomonas meleagridis TaxID=135588 RepID=UPI00355A1BE4|nr:ras-related protein RABE1c-like [Histomonas meleagridis]KAH0801551.1 ras-related protein RABE1c-like [Histomonas meleagridis]